MSGPVPRERLLGVLDRMEGVSVLVVADLVLDEFEYGTIERISREAPVLILSHRRTERLPGGGANAASNVRALDGRPLVVGRVGDDEAGERLLAIFRERGIDVSGIWKDPAYATPVKRRILAGSAHSVKQQIVRVDRGGGPPAAPEGSPFLRLARERLDGAAGALVSDYGLGLLHAGTIPPLCDALRASGRRLFVDSRAQLRLYRGVTAATPNVHEAESAAGEAVDDDPRRLARAGEALRESLGAEAVVLTQGSRGMTLFERGLPARHVPVYGTDEVADVTGAGDTVISAFTLAVLAGGGYDTAVLLANYAGGLVVMKRGTATVGREELRRAVHDDPDGDRRLCGA